jgi:mono/diheme cytochrome c family protein
VTPSSRSAAWLAALGPIVLLLGCGRPTPSSSGDPPPGPPPTTTAFDADSGPHAAGKKAMVAGGCFRCHTVAGARPGGAGRGRAPDLGNAGADPHHTAEWLTKFVRNPKEVKEGARMPAVSPEQISDDDLRAAAEYLASLK